jgi:ADP-ribosylglycohydrolase
VPDLLSRIEGGLVGLLVGDALGVPYEFHPASDIPPLEQIEFEPPSGFRRSHRSVPPGTWSDDGAQALCLVASLLDCAGFDAEDFARRLKAWHNEGYLAVDAYVFDVGITTTRAIQNIVAGTPPLQCGPAGDRDNGNGSLMRVLPLALWHQGPDEELIELAEQQSRVTHGHPRSQMACALYCLWARSLLRGEPASWQQVIDGFRSHEKRSPFLRELDDCFVREPAEVHGSGYVVDALWSARKACERESYEQVVRSAIALGNDTDTTACIAGGIAGLREGIEGIPEHWRSSLRGQELLQPLLQRLLSRSASSRS